MTLSPLPIDPLLPTLVEELRTSHNVVLHAPTGAGKTTRVPRALLDGLQPEGLILMLEPRRVAARAAAARLAEELGEPVGQTVGYQVRLDSKRGPNTKILVVTEGILLRMLVDDPLLESVDVLIFDEFHERSLNADLGLALVRQSQQELREDLRIVVMSATLRIEEVTEFLDAPVLRSEGRTFPVHIDYLQQPAHRDLTQRVLGGVDQLWPKLSGDLLVFLPGVREIEEVARALRPKFRGSAEVLSLHGRLPPSEQLRVLRPGQSRRIICATNVAETSVTLPGVDGVLDTGLVKVLRHDPKRGMDRLVLEANSQASAAQRAGRAGRVREGHALRLWTEREQSVRPTHDEPEIRRISLDAPVLQLLASGEPSATDFPWFESPRPDALSSALRTLHALGAVDAEWRITPDGHRLAQLPTSPRLARLLVDGYRHGVAPQCATIAAVLTEGRGLPPAPHGAQSDLAGVLPPHSPNSPWIQRAERQLLKKTRYLLRDEASSPSSGNAPIARCLAAAFPDRVALRRSPDSPDFLLASGRGAQLHPASAARHAQCLIALELMDSASTQARIRAAVPIAAEDLPATWTDEAFYDAATDRVVGVQRLKWGALIFAERRGRALPPDVRRDLLIEAASTRLEHIVPKDQKDFTRLLNRVAFVHRVRPSDRWPAVDDTGLLALISTLADNCKSLAELKKADWLGALQGAMDWNTLQELNTLAPDTLTVPSGSRIRLSYPAEGPPILAVRIQELFGLRSTPTVAGAPVLLHLLAPNQRPQQVTDDLPGFWARTYPDVRKELRRRYPKHSWPEDPLTASAERRPRRRS